MATAALLVAASCSACGGNDSPGNSAGTDSGFDGSEGGDGSAADSGGPDVADSALDVAADAYGEGWSLASFNPPGCQVLKATDLSKAVPPLAWKDCKNGVSNCVYLETSSLPGSPDLNGNKIGAGLNVRKFDSGVFFAIGPIYDKYVGGIAVYHVGNGPVAAWKSDREATTCAPSSFDFGEKSGGALTVGNSANDELATDILYSHETPPNIDAASKITIDKSVTGNPLAAVLKVHFSAQTMAVETGLNRLIYAWDFGPTKPTAIPKPPQIAEDYQVALKGTEMVFVRDSATPSARAFAVRHATGSVENLYQKSSVWAIDLRSDGFTLAWQELDQTSNVLELWSAPWADAPSSFTAKKVRTIEGAQDLVAAGFSGEGWWVYKKDDATLRAIRLTDGYWLDAAAPSGFGWQQPFGVVDGEIWSLVHVSPGSTVTNYSVARVPIAALGTPKP